MISKYIICSASPASDLPQSAEIYELTNLVSSPEFKII